MGLTDSGIRGNSGGRNHGLIKKVAAERAGGTANRGKVGRIEIRGYGQKDRKPMVGEASNVQSHIRPFIWVA